MVKSLITQAIVVALSMTPSGSAMTPAKASESFTIVVPSESRPIAKVHKKNYFAKMFLQFELLGRCDTNVNKTLMDALKDYTGPKVRITSLKRHWGTKSQHECGKAVDTEFSHELIEFLVTDEGKSWLERHNLMFYIEGVPSSKKLIPYINDEKFSEYVFKNPNATGDHIHIQIKK